MDAQIEERLTQLENRVTYMATVLRVLNELVQEGRKKPAINPEDPHRGWLRARR